jgi:hypothetical protein
MSEQPEVLRNAAGHAARVRDERDRRRHDANRHIPNALAETNGEIDGVSAVRVDVS